MSKTQAFREAHPGAVLIHLGETYVVSELSLENRTAYADKEDVDYYTNVIENADVKIIKKIKEKRINKNLKVTFGNVSANEFYLGYYVKMYDKIIGSYELDLPPINFDTTSIWFEISDEIKDNLRKKLGEDAFMGGLHGIEHAMIGIMPFYIMCDRWDLGGLSTNLSQETGKATIFVYDAFEGGIGLSEKTYEIFDEVLEATYKLIKDCPCEEENGCPACIHSPKCGNENETLNKLGAIKILEAILS
jgi:DEAD/DEAH box helicase domain-containing protein